MVISKAIQFGFKASRFDKKAWDALYFGIRRDIKLGIKHGFGLGSFVGTFIDEDGTGVDGGIQKNVGFTSDKSYKTRSRFSDRFTGKRKSAYCRSKIGRSDKSCRHRRSRYR